MAPGAQPSHAPASTPPEELPLLPPSFVEPPLLETLDAPLLVVDPEPLEPLLELVLVVDPEPKPLEPLFELVFVVDSEPELVEPLLGLVLVSAPIELPRATIEIFA